MTANSSVTLYHYDGEIWHRYFSAANVFMRTEGERDKGITADGSAFIRIPTDDFINIKPGDRAVIGLCEDEIPPKSNNMLEILSVTDNRRGSINMRHWKLVCK